MLFLYHFGPSVSSIKVRITLAEKRLAWEGKEIDLQRGDQFQSDYRKINPNAVVPTLIHDWRTVVESAVIIAYLDEALPEPPLMPTDPFARARARLWIKKIDDYLHLDCTTLTFAIAFRRLLQKKSDEDLEASFTAIPNLIMRERRRDAVRHGLNAVAAAAALRNYAKLVCEIDEALAFAPYLVGEHYSLADAAMTPYINRAAMLKLDVLWHGRPRVAAWLVRMRARPSFAEAVGKFITSNERDIFDVPPEETSRQARAILEDGAPSTEQLL